MLRHRFSNVKNQSIVLNGGCQCLTRQNGDQKLKYHKVGDLARRVLLMEENAVK